MPFLPDQENPSPRQTTPARKFSRRQFVASSLGIAALATSASALYTELDPSCLIRKPKNRKDTSIDWPKYVQCVAGDPVLRIYLATIFGFSSAMIWLNSNKSE